MPRPVKPITGTIDELLEFLQAVRAAKVDPKLAGRLRGLHINNSKKPASATAVRALYDVLDRHRVVDWYAMSEVNFAIIGNQDGIMTAQKRMFVHAFKTACQIEAALAAGHPIKVVDNAAKHNQVQLWPALLQDVQWAIIKRLCGAPPATLKSPFALRLWWRTNDVYNVQGHKLRVTLPNSLVDILSNSNNFNDGERFFNCWPVRVKNLQNLAAGSDADDEGSGEEAMAVDDYDEVNSDWWAIVEEAEKSRASSNFDGSYVTNKEAEDSKHLAAKDNNVKNPFFDTSDEIGSGIETNEEYCFTDSDEEEEDRQLAGRRGLKLGGPMISL